MILKDIIRRVIQIAGLEEEVNVDTPGTKLNKLIDAANMIYSELTLEYVHLKTKEKARFDGGRLYYKDLSKQVREVIEVNVRGAKVPFIMYPLYIEADVRGDAEVIYNYHLGELAIEDEVILPPQYSEYVIATGVVSEYYYRVGLIDEALFNKNRYDTAITNLSRRLRNIKLPERRVFK
ncbi:MAG: hypothetical protein WC292_06215 [Clostridia bacterium]